MIIASKKNVSNFDGISVFSDVRMKNDYFAKLLFHFNNFIIKPNITFITGVII